MWHGWSLSSWPFAFMGMFHEDLIPLIQSLRGNDLSNSNIIYPCVVSSSIYCRDPPLACVLISINQACVLRTDVLVLFVMCASPTSHGISVAVHLGVMMADTLSFLCDPIVGGFSQRTVSAHLGALHPCPHATVTWSPWGGGTQQYHSISTSCFGPILCWFIENSTELTSGQNISAVISKTTWKNSSAFPVSH